MIDLEPEYLEEVIAILEQLVPDCEVRAFGSRVTGRSQKYSDLDLVIIGKEPQDWRRLEELKDAFSESDLPIIIDVLDWHNISENFRKVISEAYVTLRNRSIGTTTIQE